MTVQVSSRYPSRQARTAEAVKAKERRQKIILAVGGAVLVLVLAVQLPGLLKQSGGAAAPATPPPAVPVSTTPAQAAPSGTGDVPGLSRLANLAAKDPFVPQVVEPGSVTTTTASAGGSSTVKGPPVDPTHFTPKDPFVPQVTVPAAATPVATTPSSTPTSPTAPTKGSGAGSPVAGSAAYIVVVATTTAGEGQAAALREEVAAQNAGLKDVHIGVLDKTPGSPRTIYLGPYSSLATANDELSRAQHVGYPQAYMRSFPHSVPGE